MVERFLDEGRTGGRKGRSKQDRIVTQKQVVQWYFLDEKDGRTGRWKVMEAERRSNAN